MPTCPGCGFETEPGRDDCPVCGRRLTETGSGEEAGPSPHGARAGPEDAAPSSEGPVAWEDASVPFPRNLVETWTESLFRPVDLFRRLSPEISLVRPLLYFLLVSVAGAFLDLLAAAAGLHRPFLEEALGVGEAPLLQFFAAPFSALLALLVDTLVLHLFVRLLVDGARRMGATARLLCYASGPGVFAFLGSAGGAPGLLASLVVMVWTFGLQAVGVREVHGTSTGRSILVVLGPIILVFFLTIFVAVFFVLAAPELPESWLPSR